MMHRLLLVVLISAAVMVVTACGVRRMAPFAPHRTNTEFHRAAKTNQACLGCHEVNTLGGDHRVSDDCLKCHRILQGE